MWGKRRVIVLLSNLSLAAVIVRSHSVLFLLASLMCKKTQDCFSKYEVILNGFSIVMLLQALS